MADARDARAAGFAALAASLLIANQVVGKAVRDALFLSTWSVERLPTMLAVAAIFSLLVVARASWVLARVGPRVAVPVAFLVSAALHAAEAALFEQHERATSIVLYLHIAALGSVLISWFWSLVNERFDPRTARRRIAFVAGGGTFGGYVGGTVAALAGDRFSPVALLIGLAVLHALVAPTLVWFARGIPTGEHRSGARPRALDGVRLVVRDGYLRNLALIVFCGTMATAGLDYAFKERAVATFGDGPPLLRFFATYYTALSFLTFVLQSVASRRLLDRLGPTGTARLLPGAVIAFGGVALALPGFVAALAARSVEAALRSSWYRSAYELFFVPVAETRKRSAKLWIDVGADRLGDAIAGALITGVVAIAGAAASTVTLAFAVACGGLVLWRLRLLQRRYVGTLEKALARRADDLDLSFHDDSGHHTVLLSRSRIPLDDEARAALDAMPPPASVPSGPHAVVRAAEPSMLDELRSGDAERVRAALREHDVPDDALPDVVALLAWDAVYVEALELLRAVPDRARPALLAALRDDDEVFAVRRRVPRALSVDANQLVVAALTRALAAKRFEVRYQSGQALWRIARRSPELRPGREALVEHVQRELTIGRSVRAGHRLLDERDAQYSEFVGDVLRIRVDRSLEHVFTLLALAFDADGIRLAYQALGADDARLRGTALEYIEGALPGRIARPLLALLEDEPGRRPARRAEADVLAELEELNRSLVLELDRASRSAAKGPDDGDGTDVP